MKTMMTMPISRCFQNSGLAAVVIAVAFASLPARAAETASETNSPSAKGEYEAFKLINERNIFNQSRYKDGTPAQPVSASRTPRIENFALVGTILGGIKGDSAFFEGSSEAFNKQVRASQTIASYTLKAIHANFVSLESEGQNVDLPLGMQMQRRDEGEWTQVEHTPVTSDIPARTQLLTRYAPSNRNGRGGAQGAGGGFGGGFANALQSAFNGGGFGGFGNGFDPSAIAAAAAAAAEAAGLTEEDSTTQFQANGGRSRTQRGGGRTRGQDAATGGSVSATPNRAQPALTTTPSTGASEAEVMERLRKAREQEQQR